MCGKIKQLLKRRIIVIMELALTAMLLNYPNDAGTALAKHNQMQLVKGSSIVLEEEEVDNGESVDNTSFNDILTLLEADSLD